MDCVVELLELLLNAFNQDFIETMGRIFYFNAKFHRRENKMKSPKSDN